MLTPFTATLKSSESEMNLFMLCLTYILLYYSKHRTGLFVTNIQTIL